MGRSHAAAGLPDAAAKATKAAAPKATEATTTAASRPIAGTPTRGRRGARGGESPGPSWRSFTQSGHWVTGLGWNGLRNFVRRVRAHRQTHREHRALARLARHGPVAAHHARALAVDGKAELGAAVSPRARVRAAYFDKHLNAESHSRSGSRSPAFASSMISLASVRVVGSLRSTNPSFAKAASNAVVKPAMSSGPNQ